MRLRAREPFVLCLDKVFAISSFQPANSKMPLRYLLKVFDEGIVHNSSAQGAYDRKRLSGHLLTDHRAEPGCHLGPKPNKDRSALLNDATLRDKPGSLGHGLREAKSRNRSGTSEMQGQPR